MSRDLERRIANLEAIIDKLLTFEVTSAGGGTLPFTSLTYSGLTTGAVVRATGATSAAFGQLDLADEDALTGTINVSHIPGLPASQISSGVLALANGGTYTNMASTGGANHVVQQASVGAGFTTGQLAAANLSDFVAPTSWTPTVVGSATAGTTTYTTQAGRHCQLNANAVVVTGFVAWTAMTGTGNLLFSLPFTSLNVANIRYAITIRSSSITFANSGLQAVLVANTNTFTLDSPISNGAPTTVAVEAAGFLDFTVTYFI